MTLEQRLKKISPRPPLLSAPSREAGIEQRLGGKIKVEIYPANQLGHPVLLSNMERSCRILRCHCPARGHGWPQRDERPSLWFDSVYGPTWGGISQASGNRLRAPWRAGRRAERPTFI